MLPSARSAAGRRGKTIEPERALSAGRWLSAHVPDVLRGLTLFGLEPWQWLGLFIAVPASYVVGRAAMWVGGADQAALDERGALVEREHDGDRAKGEDTVKIHVAIAWWLVRVVDAAGNAIDRRARANAGDTSAAELEARQAS